ncbi:MAG TPA: L-seryl-tRNA(Sec) selenium transferase [Syntrophomonadaceae bacterium]|nr:L-seryl-tRNA(Sec) selenium transferase [Syntrophomonadaceae bacterium]
MNSLQNIPSVDEMLAQGLIKEYIEKYNRDFILGLIRESIEEQRQELMDKPSSLSRLAITNLLLEKISNLTRIKNEGTLEKVINGTGVVLHTNMGRAPLGNRAIYHMVEMATNYSNLELDLIEGKRGLRYTHLEKLLVELTGAEAALVVNNNAAAVMLGLNTIALDRGVIVSRGQLIEIGGSFRIPEVMKLSGAYLVEVGTTNKTYVEDFEQAITDEIALLFSAHTSNYKIVGFAEEVELEDLVRLGRANNLPVMHDLGSGVLYDLNREGLKDEPTVQECIASGVDIVTFSGDKLLGGPQAGIIVGKKEYIDLMKKNQLTRALRVDKLTIAALEGTLMEYRSGRPEKNIPILAMLTMKVEEIHSRAQELLHRLETELAENPNISQIKLVSVADMVGGGAYPTYHIPGYGVEIKFHERNLADITKCLRCNKPALVTRVQADSILISVRTLVEGDIEQIPVLISKVLV